MIDPTKLKLGGHVSDLFLRANACFQHHPTMTSVGRDWPMARFHSSKDASPEASLAHSLCYASAEALCATIHELNVQAGWWTDLNTGEKKFRNVGELLMLVVTELEEAREGLQLRCCDDKLPNRGQLEVEMADALIRVFDLCGAYVPAFAQIFADECFAAIDFQTTVLQSPFEGVIFLSRAMEASRKSRPLDAHLAKFVVWALRFCLFHNLQISSALEEKVIYNFSRPDHKIENRVKPDGKKT